MVQFCHVIHTPLNKNATDTMVTNPPKQNCQRRAMDTTSTEMVRWKTYSQATWSPVRLSIVNILKIYVRYQRKRYKQTGNVHKTGASWSCTATQFRFFFRHCAKDCGIIICAISQARSAWGHMPTLLSTLHKGQQSPQAWCHSLYIYMYIYTCTYVRFGIWEHRL